MLARISHIISQNVRVGTWSLTVTFIPSGAIWGGQGGLAVSLFEHIQQCGVTPHLLDTQYRCTLDLEIFRCSVQYIFIFAINTERADGPVDGEDYGTSFLCASYICTQASVIIHSLNRMSSLFQFKKKLFGT